MSTCILCGYDCALSDDGLCRDCDRVKFVLEEFRCFEVPEKCTSTDGVYRCDDNRLQAQCRATGMRNSYGKDRPKPPDPRMPLLPHLYPPGHAAPPVKLVRRTREKRIEVLCKRAFFQLHILGTELDNA